MNIANYIKPAFWIIIVAIVVVAAVVAGLMANPYGKDGENDEFLTAAKKYLKYRTEYVGNAPKVGGIISLLDFPEKVYYDDFELYTDTAPYTVTVNLKTDTETRNYYTGAVHEASFMKNAIIMFSLIGNVDYINFNLTNGQCDHLMQYTKEWADNKIGQDVREFSAGEKEFAQFLKTVEDLYIGEAIVSLVESFGSKLQKVSLQASKDVVIESIQENYSEYVSPALMDEWKSDPFKAPGRLTSSPWPDRIEVLTIEKLSADSYQVNGKIIEITNEDMIGGGFSASRPLDLLVKKTGDRMFIDQLILGEYEEDAPAYTNNQGNPTFEFALVKDLAARYGYDWGAILTSNEQTTELLLYNEKIEAKDDLKAKKIKLNHEDGAEYAKDVYLPEELLDYSFTPKYGNAVQKKYLLGIRSTVKPQQKKLYSDLLIMDKDNLEQMTILQSYALNYDPSTGRISQGIIPTIIDFTVDLIDDYIVYQDTDLFWKVQDVRSGIIYTSDENETSLKKVQIYYQEKGQDDLDAGKYIYILKYINDNSILAFDAIAREFIRLNGIAGDLFTDYYDAADPVEVVCADFISWLIKDYTISMNVHYAEVDDAETQRMIEMYKGSELAESRGWTDEILEQHFVVVKVRYECEFDHTKTFYADGLLEKYVFLTREAESGVWTIVDGTSPWDVTE